MSKLNARPNLSVVIPVLDDALPLEALLQGLSKQSDGLEVLVVDGGSQDRSRDVAAKHGARVLSTETGRGRQLNAGCQAAQGNWLWLLHADSRPSAEAVREMCVRSGSECATMGWGRFNVCFDDDAPSMRLTAALMNVRSRLTGICTGDQGIYLHRRLLDRIGGVPEQPLMEDVELSRRLRQFCKPTCSASRVQTAARRWQQAGWLKTVLAMWRCRLRYWSGTPAELLAREYYRG